MMELKFRAWDGKKLHLWDSETHPAAGSLECVYPKLHYLPMSYLAGDSNDWVWEQFTGLTDVDGEDIYVGDIVEWDVEMPGTSFTMRETIGSLKTAFDFEGSEETETWRVVGNVHQNPELLTEDHD